MIRTSTKSQVRHPFTARAAGLPLLVCAFSAVAQSVPASAPASPASAASIASQMRVEPRPQAIVTAPSIKPNILNEQGLARDGYGLSSTAVSTGAPNDMDALTWLLAPNLLPYPLRYEYQAQSEVLVVRVPTVAEARMMLPGQLLDMADEARSTISRFMTAATSRVVQTRAHQKGQLSAWLSQTNEQAKQLSANPWQIYQFHRMVNAEAMAFKSQFAGQSEPEAQELFARIKPLIGQITPLLNELPTQETRMAWYGIMVQLKESFQVFQAQMSEGEREPAAVLDQILSVYKELPRPAGSPPPKPGTSTSPESRRNGEGAASTARSSSDSGPKEAAQPPAVKKEETNPLVGGLVMLGLAVGLVFYVLRLKKKVSKSKPSE